MSSPISSLACVVISVLGVLIAAAPGNAASIFYDDGDGVTGTLAGTWNNLQQAIGLAEGGGNPGAVKVSGDLARIPADTTVGDLDVALGNLSISGGWHDGAGGDGFAVQGAKSLLNVNGAATSTDAYRVLRISGSDTTVDNFVITGGLTDRRQIDDATDGVFHAGAGIHVNATPGIVSNVTLKNLTVTGNVGNYAYNRGDGGGVSVTGGFNARKITVSNVTVSQNQGPNGGGIWADGGRQQDPFIIEYSTISDNWATGTTGGGNACGGGIGTNAGNWGSHWVVVANSRITGNKATYGGGICMNSRSDSASVIVFGSLIASNTIKSGGWKDEKTNPAWVGSALYGGGHGGLDYIVNTTIVDNVHPEDPSKAGIHLKEPAYNHKARTYFLNSIVKDNNGIDVHFAGGSEAHMATQRSTYDDTPYEEDGVLSSATLAAALGVGIPLYHSLTDAGVEMQTLQNDIEGDPSFLGSGDDPYQLTPGSNSLDNGLTLSGSFVYVDLNINGSYDAMLDVIVAGTPPPGGNLVYTTDLLGNARVYGLEIDRGAYEYVPEPATMALLGLGFGRLLVLRRRRKR